MNELKLVFEPSFSFLEEFGSVRCSRIQRQVMLNGEIAYYLPRYWVPAFAMLPPYTVIAERVDRFRFGSGCWANLGASEIFTLHPRGRAAVRIRTPFLYGTFDCPS